MRADGFRDGYWPEHEEEELIWLWKQVLCHDNARVAGQNLLYEYQYLHKHWGFIPPSAFDTMIAHHTAFAGLPKALDFQASMYCERYRYWGEASDWRTKGEEWGWRYNCEDCARTYEIAEVLGGGA